MIRKSTACLASIVMIMALLYGCQDEIITGETIVVTTGSQIVTTTESIDSLTERVSRLAERISQLVKEDGTGIISFGMHRSDVLKILDEQGIPYNEIAGDIELGDSIYFGQGVVGGGTYYLFEHDTLQFKEIFMKVQSFRGLKKGDPVQRIFELYGEPDEFFDSDDQKGYRYYFPSDKDTVIFYIGVRGDGDDARVYEMNLFPVKD